MQEHFPGFRTKTPEEIAAIWRQATFSFDANVLLHPYRVAEATRRDLLASWEKLSGRCWITHQAALEYHRQVDRVISDQQGEFGKLRSALRQGRQQANNAIKDIKRHPSISPDALLEKLDEGYALVADALKRAELAHPDSSTFATIRDRVGALFADHLGRPYGHTEIDAIYATAERRFALRIPPGYEDERKGGARQFGDALIWLQLIDFAQQSPLPIVFVTDDEKGDWQDTRSLAQEMHDRASVAYLQLTSTQFIAGAKRHLLGLENIADASIEELAEVAEEARAAAQAVERGQEPRNLLPEVVALEQRWEDTDAIRGLTMELDNITSQLERFDADRTAALGTHRYEFAEIARGLGTTDDREIEELWSTRHEGRVRAEILQTNSGEGFANHFASLLPQITLILGEGHEAVAAATRAMSALQDPRFCAATAIPVLERLKFALRGRLWDLR